MVPGGTHWPVKCEIRWGHVSVGLHKHTRSAWVPVCLEGIVSTMRTWVHSMVPLRMLPESLTFPKWPPATSTPLLLMWTELSCIKSHLETSLFKLSQAQKWTVHKKVLQIKFCLEARGLGHGVHPQSGGGVWLGHAWVQGITALASPVQYWAMHFTAPCSQP